MDEFGKEAQDFCDEHAARVSHIVAFLANAKTVRPSYNKPCTKMRVGLRVDKTIVKIEVDVDRMSDWELEEKLTKALFKKFGLGREFSRWSNARERVFRRPREETRKELVRRGGGAGLDRLICQVRRLKASKVPQKKMRARRVQGDLNRALSHLKVARKSGATIRQLYKLVRTVMAEEAVAEVQGL